MNQWGRPGCRGACPGQSNFAAVAVSQPDHRNHGGGHRGRRHGLVCSVPDVPGHVPTHGQDGEGPSLTDACAEIASASSLVVAPCPPLLIGDDSDAPTEG
eukprot:gene5635-biopygen187